MADEYGFPNTEEEFKALLDELLGKETDMSNLDFGNNEEDLQNLQNQLEKAEQAYARKALSQALGIDLDKLAALIEDNAAEQTNEETDEQMADTQTEQTEAESETVLIPDDMFGAKDLNDIYDLYRASEFNIGSVIAIKGAEFFKAAVPHDDHTHNVWIDTMGRMLPDNDMAKTARYANATNDTNVTKIIHLG